MKAAAIDRFGPPEVLTPRSVPVPRVGPDEVLIALHAAGVGIWDAKLRGGTYASGRERFPLVPGTDGAGVIAQRGARVRAFDMDQAVWAYEYANPKGGFYAEFVAVKAESVGPVPRELSLLEAGASCVTGLTAHQGIDTHLALQAGETVLVFGASGAVGTLAVQFAKCHRARVIGTATGAEAQGVVRELGADGVVDARRDDAPARLRELAPDGLDAVLALGGGDGLERCLELVRKGGRVAYPNGVEPEPRPRPGIEVMAYDAIAARSEFAALERAIQEARLRVVIAATYPLDQAAQAHAELERGHTIGRIVLRIRE
jgi:NADPH:quinone reductase-like Zn-dependent oxidoreductase